MDRKQAYDFFLKALTAQMVQVMNELDSSPVGFPQYAALTEKQIRIQNALANLDDIANLI